MKLREMSFLCVFILLNKSLNIELPTDFFFKFTYSQNILIVTGALRRRSGDLDSLKRELNAR